MTIIEVTAVNYAITLVFRKDLFLRLLYQGTFGHNMNFAYDYGQFQLQETLGE